METEKVEWSRREEFVLVHQYNGGTRFYFLIVKYLEEERKGWEGAAIREEKFVNVYSLFNQYIHLV